MKKRKLPTFTMIELVFILVIIGILASIAIPRLAASRDDAIAVSLKADIGTIMQAMPALYMSQGDNLKDFSQAINVDSSRWIQNNQTLTSVLHDNNSPCVKIEYTNATQNRPSEHIKMGDKILELSILARPACLQLNRLFHTSNTDYTQVINLSGYGISF
ncbi:hypothetical protein CCZ01_02530 [Helicobacter monodelphidis]|uniref:type II secretion system protein n=1 Tax=Helicobacter sp. 15-1451 TaxID=2004995 RepID=UPI000DCD61D0|nr:type II secretion system GspH family protein [Helicobacter sp. 15-1451]RAX58677.1 hypothetical protein CCZ01_02530 [Helicobacter sp. 15-1451]